jgi:GMP synthase-like glutamine amidotransferase
VHVHCCQHVPFEGPAGIEAWARERGHDLTRTAFFDGADAPALGDVDALVVLGGPMGVHDDAEYPFLRAERGVIARALDDGIPVLGVCLGAQQLARACGADVYPHDTREIGWFPVKATDAAADSPLAPLGERYTPLHWHGDTFDLPAGADLLATSEACRNQAFLTDDGLGLGLQFHLEATPESVARLVEASSGLGGSEWVQGPKRLRAGGAYELVREGLDAVLDGFFVSA